MCWCLGLHAFVLLYVFMLLCGCVRLRLDVGVYVCAYVSELVNELVCGCAVVWLCAFVSRVCMSLCA